MENTKVCHVPVLEHAEKHVHERQESYVYVEDRQLYKLVTEDE
jgi:hypothetical protein